MKILEAGEVPKIFAARFLCVCQENDFDMVCKIWRHYISTMDMKFTCITRDKTRVFVRDPMMKYSRAGDKQKPIMYISVDKDCFKDFGSWVSSVNETRRKLDNLLSRELDKLSRHDQKRSLYCWRKYLFRLGGFKTIGRETLLDNLMFFADGFVVLDNPLSKSMNMHCFQREEFMVADKVFALKCVALGLPDISSMNFRMPKSWSQYDFSKPNPDLRFDFSKVKISSSREKQVSLFEE